MKRTARWIAVTALAIFSLFAGGRIVGSDEVTMLEVSRALLRGRVDVPEGATMSLRDGRFVSKNAAGQAVAVLPLVALAEGAARLSGLDPARQALAVRFVASFFNAIVTALLLAVFYLGARRLGVTPGAALAAAAMLGFTTPLWVYSKSFLAEPMQALGLLMALVGASVATAPDSERDAKSGARWAGIGAFLALSAKLSMLPLVVASLAPLLAAPRALWRLPAWGVLLALIGHVLYNVARFGTPFETGYGVQATPAAYTTPLMIGLYGLLISSGKGVLWFAPGLWLAPIGWCAMRAGPPLHTRWPAWLGLGRPRGAAALGALLAWCVGLLLYGTFQHWAGDGSFGPRYLLPLLPAGFLAVAFALAPHAGQGSHRSLRVVGGVLAMVGLLVQVGGVGIHYGAQMREAGDYPYTLPLEHPRFMSDSHFNPAFSPIADHWRMLVRNARLHLRGEGPVLEVGEATDPRLVIGPKSQRQLLHALDLWWFYLGYAGFPRGPVILSVLALVMVTVLASRQLLLTWGDERAAERRVGRTAA